MVRRDRNHACIFLWEPILNETWYPDYFAKKVRDIVKEEFPYKSSYSACDYRSKDVSSLISGMKMLLTSAKINLLIQIRRQKI